jgi:hypothetical protein
MHWAPSLRTFPRYGMHWNEQVAANYVDDGPDSTVTTGTSTTGLADCSTSSPAMSSPCPMPALPLDWERALGVLRAEAFASTRLSAAKRHRSP